jgi:hypothetical protein
MHRTITKVTYVTDKVQQAVTQCPPPQKKHMHTRPSTKDHKLAW